jgi:hypothetical protein
MELLARGVQGVSGVCGVSGVPGLSDLSGLGGGVEEKYVSREVCAFSWAIVPVKVEPTLLRFSS